jgi:formate--tetrahydrofolate ligase
MNTDLAIANSVELKPIKEIAAQLGIGEDQLDLYGNYKAKLPLDLIDESVIDQKKLILVTAMTPTPAGEGKTTVSIGLTQGLNKIGKKSIVVLREPSLGPVFGIKGGAAGGGYSQVLPMEDINLHFTGDISAVEKANNLLSALIDNRLWRNVRTPEINPKTLKWKRVMDVNDRALRFVMTGLGSGKHGIPVETGFNITAASEVMAILCMSKDRADLKEKLGNIYIANDYDRNPVFARDIKAHGAMAALLKDAIRPNLVQTIEHTPAIIHGGPFANIAQGTNTIIATKMGLSLSEYVVTEAGFASDLGAEKFFDIKCRHAGLSPRTVVVVATIRALKYHGGVSLKELNDPNSSAVQKGLPNLTKHIENMQAFNLNPVIAINQFTSDSPEEIQVVLDHCISLGVKAAVANVWGKGGEGTTELASLVADEADAGQGRFKLLYPSDASVEEKIETIAKKIYGADGVQYEMQARNDLRKIKRLGMEDLAICIAKTQNSLSDNSKLLGRPTGFTVEIREIQIAAGAGFLIPIAGDIMRMPGLGKLPAAENIDIDDNGNIIGLF